jgi:hypothetical protein
MLLLGGGTASAGANVYAGRNPEATGCADDAQTIDRKPVGPTGAEIWLRYSPSCRTVWAHISNASPARPGDSAGGSALIYREQDGASDRCNAGSATSCSTAMLNDAGYTSHATGTNDTGSEIFRAQTISY